MAVATVPLFTLAFAQWGGQRGSAREWWGIALGLGGIVLLNLGANLQASPLGAALLLLASASWALGSVWGKRLDLPAGAMAPAAEMLAGGTVLALGSLLSGERLQHWPTPEGWLALLYLVVFGSLVAFSAYLYLLKTVRPAVATSYAYVNPVVAVGLGKMSFDKVATHTGRAVRVGGIAHPAGFTRRVASRRRINCKFRPYTASPDAWPRANTTSWR